MSLALDTLKADNEMIRTWQKLARIDAGLPPAEITGRPEISTEEIAESIDGIWEEDLDADPELAHELREVLASDSEAEQLRPQLPEAMATSLHAATISRRCGVLVLASCGLQKKAKELEISLPWFEPS